MWKKTENHTSETASPTPSYSTSHPEPVAEQAVIGSSLIVRGDVTGEEDLLIQGQVDGKVILKKNGITVGRNGRVKADIYGKTITVEGVVQGNLYAEERIMVRKSGDVKGNLHSPRVTLEDGARFKGAIDMEGRAPDKTASGSRSDQGAEKTESLSTSEKSGPSSSQGSLGIKVNQPSKT